MTEIEETYLRLLYAIRAPLGEDVKEVPFSSIQSWTPEQHRAAREWAIAERKGGNGTVEMPEFIRPFFE